MKNVFFLAIGIIFFAGSFYYFLKQPASPQYQNLTLINIGETRVAAEVRDTPEGRQRGLSGREKLASGEGMLFVFEKPGIYGIWMKDMNFPIDILWLDERKRIIWIEESVTPETYPKVFYPEKPALYVLELESGFISEYSIDIGEIVSWREEF